MRLAARTADAIHVGNTLVPLRADSRAPAEPTCNENEGDETRAAKKDADSVTAFTVEACGAPRERLDSRAKCLPNDRGVDASLFRSLRLVGVHDAS